MSVNAILTLNKPMAPYLIQILYWIALVLIAFGLLHGVIGGVRTMTRPMPPHAAIAALSPSAPGTMAPVVSAPNGWRAGWPPHRSPGPDFGFRHFRGHDFAGHGPRGFMMMHGMSPPIRSGLHILLALIRGMIVLMLVRVLAEISTAILAMGAKVK